MVESSKDSIVVMEDVKRELPHLALILDKLMALEEKVINEEGAVDGDGNVKICVEDITKLTSATRSVYSRICDAVEA